MKKNCFKSLKL